jgi:hypothetical protein
MECGQLKDCRGSGTEPVNALPKYNFQDGSDGIQCMYAPEFNSHSESIWVEAE